MDPKLSDLDWYAPLRKAAFEGDWKEAKKIFDSDPRAKFAKISRDWDTALHVAAESGQTKFVKKLVNLISPEEILGLKNKFGHTALFTSVIAGDVEAAKAMVIKNPKLTQIRSKKGETPIYKAALRGFKDLLWFLCKETKDYDPSPFGGTDGLNLFTAAISAGFYDVALHLLRRFPQFATGRHVHGLTALAILAQKSSTFKSGSRLGFWQRSIYSCIPISVEEDSTIHTRTIGDVEDPARSFSDPARSFSDRSQNPNKQQFLRGAKVIQVPVIKQISHIKSIHIQAHKLVHLICHEVTLFKRDENFVKSLGDTVLVAAEFGIVEVIEPCLKCYPQELWYHRTDTWHSMLHKAVIHRQAKVFKFVRKFGARTNKLASWYEESTGNNILHLAAILPSKPVLNAVSGEALQMQRELQWFKEVEKIVQPKFKEYQNKSKQTPHVLFTEEHKELVEKGEKWMKETAASCMVVAALIATVVFAAALTVPGGNNSNDGKPFFLKAKAFMVFAIADSLALFTSSISVLIFLSILTSRYAEEDFLVSLPRKLIFGLLTLFFSIATMMTAFSATYFIMLDHQLAWVSILIALVASLPVFFFAISHVCLFVEMICFTYGYNTFPQ